MKNPNINILSQVSNGSPASIASKLKNVSALQNNVSYSIVTQEFVKNIPNLVKQNQDLFHPHLNPLSAVNKFKSSPHPKNLNSSHPDFDLTKDYRSFKNLSDFTDENIFYNVNMLCYSKSIRSLFSVNDSKNKLFLNLKLYRDACVNGDIDSISLIDAETYKNNSNDTDDFHSFFFEIKKKMFELAQNEGKFLNSSTAQTFFIYMAASKRQVPNNLYVDSSSNDDFEKLGKSSYNKVHEITMASIAANGNSKYLYYVTFDRKKTEIDTWLTSEGYTQVGSIPQERPDLVIIDLHRKLYIYYDIKNCLFLNSSKFLAFDDQFLIFFGHLSAVDKAQFLVSYSKKQLKGLSDVMRDKNADSAAKTDAQYIYNKIMNGTFIPEEIFNSDPFISTTSSVVLPEML